MTKKITYKSAGVDINKANVFVKAIARDVKATHSANVLRREGAFGGLFRLPKGNWKSPVFVSSTDGVGTKLLIAQSLNKHDTVGIDLVAMNVNDVLCVGAKPLFFLDYIACGKLKPSVLTKVVSGIARGCRQCECALIAGETAEMPDMYKKDEYDLAGFAVGVIEEKDIIDGAKIKSGDVVIGFSSNGIHSNGYSLVRKVLGKAGLKKYKTHVLAPTKIYFKEVMTLIENVAVKGLAHITGGAYYEKLTKVLPKGLAFVINKSSWPVPEIFQIIQKKGKVQDAEMYRTFNMGIGMAAVISAKDLARTRAILRKKRIQFYEIGNVVKDSKRRIIFS